MFLETETSNKNPLKARKEREREITGWGQADGLGHVLGISLQGRKSTQ